MQTRTHNPFTTIHTEGSLLPTDLLQRVLAVDPKLEGLSLVDYHLPAGEKLNEAINRSWNQSPGGRVDAVQAAGSCAGRWELCKKR